MSATEFITVRDERTGDEWPTGRHSVVTQVTGELADKIRQRAERDGRVKIVERGEEGGYSEWTVEWEYDFRVYVGDEEVWSSEAGFSASDFDGPSPWSPLAYFLAWVDGR